MLFKNVCVSFSNKKLNDIDKHRLEIEYVRRASFVGHMLKPMLIKWRKEFKELYPDKPLDSMDYYSFAKSKFDNMDLLYIGNKQDIGFNVVKLKLDENQYRFNFIGISEVFNTDMRFEWCKE